MAITVLITGATSGIGFELAKLYHAQNDKVIIVGRKGKEDLTHSLFYQTAYLQGDLSQPYASEKVKKYLNQSGIKQLDLLIHNAAVGHYGEFAQQSSDLLDKLLQTNLYTPIALTHALLPFVRDKGKIVFISSVAANLPVPDYAVYGASKAALSGFVRNLRLEQNRIAIQTIYPGATRTPMHAKSGVPEGKLKLERFPSSSDVAKKIQLAITTSRSEVTIGTGNALLRSLGRFLNRPLDYFMRRQV